MALNAKYNLGLVDGSIVQPPSSDPFFGAWSCCKSMVSLWLLNAVSKEIADSRLYLDSAKAVWDDWQLVFSKGMLQESSSLNKSFRGCLRGRWVLMGIIPS